MGYVAAPKDTARRPGYDVYDLPPSGDITPRIPFAIAPNGSTTHPASNVAGICNNLWLDRRAELPEFVTEKVTISNAKFVKIVDGKYVLVDLKPFGAFTPTRASFRPGKRSSFEARGADIVIDALVGGECYTLATDIEIQESLRLLCEIIGAEGTPLKSLNETVFKLLAARQGVVFEKMPKR